jgi:hypothetical protein
MQIRRTIVSWGSIVMRICWPLLLVGCEDLKTSTTPADSGEPEPTPTTSPVPEPTSTSTPSPPACALVTPIPPTATEPCPTTTPPTAPYPECVDLQVLPLSVCAETTAPRPARAPGDATPLVCAGSGSIVEAGLVEDPSTSTGTATGTTTTTITGPPPPPGPRSIEGFPTCAGQPGVRVRLVDDEGYSWTFGWALDDRTDASALALEPGEVLDFEIRWLPEAQPSDQGSRAALVLSEDQRLQLVYERGLVLTQAERGGIGVELLQDGCVPYPYSYDQHDVVAVSWCDGSSLLRTGDSGTVGVLGADDTQLDFHVAAAYENVEGDCVIGCKTQAWAVVATPAAR